MTETKAAPSAAKKPETKEPRPAATAEAIMGCGCRLIMDEATFTAEGPYCEVHDTAEIARVIKAPEGWAPKPPAPEPVKAAPAKK